jgi:phage tail P2-like protein
MAIDTEITAKSLLPPNSSEAEHALEDTMRMDVDLSPVGTLWNPASCPVAVLPFLAWGLAIARWDSTWTESEKRAAIADAIPFHKRKGTRAAVMEVLERFHPLLELVEGWETDPRGLPHSFEVRASAALIPADFLTAETATSIIRDVAAAKPVRSHFNFVQYVEAHATSYLSAALLPASYGRYELTASHDDDPAWDNYLQTENGEPMQAEDGQFLEVL